jgi:uncharacterized protein (DUF983 family)
MVILRGLRLGELSQEHYHHFKIGTMLVISIIIFLVIGISIFVFPRITNKLQLNIFYTIQIFLITSIFTMGSYLSRVLESQFSERTELISISVILSLIVGLTNNKYYKKFGLKK